MSKVLLTAMMALALPACAENLSTGDWEMISGQNSSIGEPKMTAVRDAGAWAELWSKHHKGGPQAEAVPAVDFTKETVVAVFLGEKPTAGYKVDLALRQDPLDPRRLFVLYREIAPRDGAFVLQVLSRPFEIRKVRKAYASVVFEPNSRMKTLPIALTPETRAKIDGSMSILREIAESAGRQSLP